MRLTVERHHRAVGCVRAPAQYEFRGLLAPGLGAPGPTEHDGIVGLFRRALVLPAVQFHAPAQRRIDGVSFVPCALALPRALPRATAPHNETLQLPGAEAKEVVVAAALAGAVSKPHLPGQ